MHLFSKPLFPYLLVIFFLTHGIAEYFPLITISDVWSLFLQYIVFTSVLWLAGWLFFRNHKKAAILAVIITSFNFFFGSIHDSLKNALGYSFLTKYSVLLPAWFILLTLLIYLIKISKSEFRRLFQYLNILILILILIDLGYILSILNKKPIISTAEHNLNFTPCQSCENPDIYLVVLDEYAGKKELSDIFSFDNTEFENELLARGFHVINNSISNYNYTEFSMASMLNMEYLNKPEETMIEMTEKFASRDLINRNVLFNFFETRNYVAQNLSFFTIENEIQVKNLYSRKKSNLISSQTFIERFKKDLGHNFASEKKLLEIIYDYNHYNSKIDSLTRNVVKNNAEKQKFIYTHFNMPHYPYYFDDNGRKSPVENLAGSYKTNRKAYINYLKFTNQKILSLVDFILANSSRPPVIILAGDHGFRQFRETTDKKYYFMNLAAVLLPNRNYEPFYDSMSNVNLFRAVLNAQFGQNLAYKKDSTIFLYEP